MVNPVIKDILSRVLMFYIGETFVLLGVTIMCMWCVVKNKHSNYDKLGILSAVLVIFFFVNLFVMVIPVCSDYFTNNIISVNGIYSNTNSAASTDLLGIYGVTISVADAEIHLTTAPLHSESDFPEGSLEVTAYYTGKSKILLLIEYDTDLK